jgi:hypothetical protein
MSINHYNNIPTGLFDANFHCVAHGVSSKDNNIGIINWWAASHEEAKIENLKKFVESQDICFFVSEEVYHKHNSIDMNKVFEMLNSHNVYYILFSYDLTLSVQPDPNRTYCNPWFFKSPLYVPSNFVPDLDYVEKQYAFNLMLGSNKSYRTIAYKVLKDNKNIYSKYLGHPEFKFDSIISLDEDDVASNLISQDVAQHKLNTTDGLERQGREYAIANIIPEKIYANTHFDIVTETFVKHQNMFITEKTAKPLATGRFFCWYNSNNVINYLQQFGFDFTHYEAEYDIMPNDVDRLNAILDLVKEIANNHLFIRDIYKKSKPARIHNMEVFNQHTKNFHSRLDEWLSSCLSCLNN